MVEDHASSRTNKTLSPTVFTSVVPLKSFYIPDNVFIQNTNFSHMGYCNSLLIGHTD